MRKVLYANIGIVFNTTSILNHNLAREGHTSFGGYYIYGFIRTDELE